MWKPQYLILRRELREVAEAERKLNASVPADPDAAAHFHQHYEGLYEWRQLVLTRYWEGKAASLGVPMPDWSDNSLCGQVDFDNDERQPRYLTEAGILKLRTDIREEQRHRRDVVLFWFGIAMGVIGALTGLVSAFKD